MYFTKFLTKEADIAPGGSSDIFILDNNSGLDEICFISPMFGLSKIRPSTELTLSYFLNIISVIESNIFALSSPITKKKFKSGTSFS